MHPYVGIRAGLKTNPIVQESERKVMFKFRRADQSPFKNAEKQKN